MMQMKEIRPGLELEHSGIECFLAYSGRGTKREGRRKDRRKEGTTATPRKEGRRPPDSTKVIIICSQVSESVSCH